MPNEELAAPVSPLAPAVNVYPDPAFVITRFENVATPFTALAVNVPDNVPPLGFEPNASVIVPPKPVATFPLASRAVTCTAGEIGLPAVEFRGCTVNASCVAGGATQFS